MAIPIRIQRSRQHKQVSPNGLPIKYVGRPGRFGNPFKIGMKVNDPQTGNYITTLKTIDDVIKWYKKYLSYMGKHEEIKSELKGKNLSCWCPIDKKCHADVLLEIANK